ncbi:MAG TPA: hypothetical protein VD994_16910, partial [Prosthecobacter sp.]|nr:hypothetical protein [Prosthecobacter sp.]
KLLAHDAAWTPERGRSQVAALFRARSRDAKTLKQLLGWMQQQAKGLNQAAWRTLLRAEARAGTDRPVAALALCAFAKDMPESAGDDLLQGWKAAREGDRICLQLAAQALLEAGRAHWAWQACLVLKDLPSLRLDGQKLPMMVTVAHAMADHVVVRELFSEVVHMPSPGGNRPLEWIEAFAKAGEDGLTRELFQAALDHLDATETADPDLYAAWIRFLIQHGEFDPAESFLLRHNWLLANDSPKLIFELYQAWGKLGSLAAELPKFHLPGGLEKEVLFLTSQALGFPPPVPVPASAP